jgi:hypothetical protein
MICTPSPNVIPVIKLKRIRWAGHVAQIGRGEVHTGFWWGNPSERDQLEDPGVDGRIILRWIFRKWDVGVWTGLIWHRIGACGANL